MKVALYLRVSTAGARGRREQTTENQRLELEAAAHRLGHEIVEVYEDAGISGAKGRDRRPAFDRLHKDATRRKFDLVMAWSVDRLGRSLPHLVHFLDHIHASGVGLYLHQQGLDTTTPSGRAMFQMMGVFAEFERAMIRERTIAGLERARIKGTKSGKAIGRPQIKPGVRTAIREAYARGDGGYRTIAKQFGVAVMTVRNCLAAEA
jgi:DNA invertase Pin-like site-specific DNA recombinase